jgi:hypothetical protein
MDHGGATFDMRPLLAFLLASTLPLAACSSASDHPPLAPPIADTGVDAAEAGAPCSDGKRDYDETDIDCGGSRCSPCKFGKTCSKDADCSTSKCTGGSCACPDGMVVAPAAGGGRYCIDAHEVTAGDYYKFWSTGPSTSGQPAECAWNSNWTPSAIWPPVAGEPKPVRWVDWCDAYGYCKFAKKELCGKIGGGANAPSGDAFKDAAKSAWYNACSAQGTNAFPNPNDTVFDNVKCNGKSVNTDVWATNKNTCVGGVAGLYDMSGNVEEWENSCETATGENDNCHARGGAWDTGEETWLRCDADTTRARNYQAQDLGFRCCAY